MWVDLEGANGGKTGGDRHGKPVGLDDASPCRRDPRRARHRLRRPHRLGAPHAGAALRVRQGRARGRLQGNHRRGRRRRAPARHDGGADHAAGFRGAGGVEDAGGRRFALLDRADAARRAGRHPRHRPPRRDQRRAARRERAGAGRRRPGGAARGVAPAPDRGRRRAPNRRARRVTGTSPALGPDGTLGILGGGQLGRMLALAAARLGLKCHVYSPDPQSPAFDVVRRATRADYSDESALDSFAGDVDVVTYEFENVPAETARFLAARRPVLPDPAVLATTQDRLIEKDFIAGLQIATAPYRRIDAPADLAPALDAVGRPAVLKTRRFGYDGKGQVLVRNGGDPGAAWNAIGGTASILEAFVAFEREISVVAARGRDGRIACFDVTENEHRDHILKVSRVPAAVTPAVAAEARR